MRFSRLRGAFEISSAARGRIKISKNLPKVVLALHQPLQLRLRENQHKQVSTNPFQSHNIPFQLILSKSETAPPPQPSTAVPPESEVPNQSSQPQLPLPPKGAADVNQSQEALPSTAQTPTSDKAPPLGRAGKSGMSATSGPLDDQMVHEYSDVGTDEAPAPVAKKAEAAEAATAVGRTALKA